MVQAKRKGTRLERKTLRWLHQRGWRAWRAPASLGVFDIQAYGIERTGGRLRFIQVKANRWAGPKERAAMIEEIDGNGEPERQARFFSVEQWCWRDYARTPLVRVWNPISRSWVEGVEA